MSNRAWVIPGAKVAVLTYLNGDLKLALTRMVTGVTGGIATLDDGSNFSVRTLMKELEQAPCATVLANLAEPAVAEQVRELGRGRAARAIRECSEQFNASPSEAAARELLAAVRDYLAG